MDFTKGQLTLLAYWGTIQASVAQRQSTAQLWDAVRSAAEIDGKPLSGVGAVDMNVLRSIAAEQRTALDNLNGARLDQAIDPTMIARDVSSRPLGEQNAAPSWLVRFEHDVIIDGQLTTLWRTSTFDGFLPATKANLLATVTSDAEALADDYGVTHAGVGRMFISAV